MAQRQTHEIAIDSLLDKLRCAMLGYLQPCLPEHLITRSEQRRAIRTAAERLVLCVAITLPAADTTTLQACRSRLHTALTYLFFECRESDRTFAGLLQIIALDKDIWANIVARARYTPRSFRRRYRHLPILDVSIESAVLLCLGRAYKIPPLRVCSLITDQALSALKSA